MKAVRTELRVVLVGRHKPDFGDQPIVVVSQEAVTWPVAASLCIPEMHRLEQLARERGAQAIVLQNVPVQLAGAIATLAYLSPGGHQGLAWYGIVSVPGDRPGNVTKTLSVPSSGTDALKKLISFANPRAKVVIGGDAAVPDDEGYVVGFDPSFTTVTVEVDGPPMPFRFSHLEPLL